MSEISTQMKHREKDLVPLFLVRAMLGLMAVTLMMVAYAQWFDVEQRGVVVEAPVVNEITVRFESTREGISTVYDMDGNQIAHSSDELMGFIGVIGIVVRRERFVSGVANDAPLNILQRANGTYAIEDPLTGWSVELIGYGQDNVAAFAKLLN